jgi:DNA-binding MarR family transcriptional regulator
MSALFEERVSALLRRLARLRDRRSRQLQHELGLTGPQLATLQLLERAGALTPGALAREVDLSPATVTGLLDKLEAKELVERTRSTTDRRSVVVRPTAQARALLEATQPALHTGWSARLMQLPEEDRALLLRALELLTTLLHEEADASGLQADLARSAGTGELNPRAGADRSPHA